MKTLLLISLLSFATCFLTVQPACVSGTQIEHNGLACAGKEVTPAILTQVAVDLFTKNFGDLEALAAQHGLSWVNCVVTTAIASQAAPSTGSGAKAEPSPIAINGTTWLVTHGGSQ